MHICQQGIYCTYTQLPGERGARDELRVIADLPGLLDKIIGANGNTVAADHAKQVKRNGTGRPVRASVS